jgi:hypothetical protein
MIAKKLVRPENIGRFLQICKMYTLQIFVIKSNCKPIFVTFGWIGAWTITWVPSSGFLCQISGQRGGKKPVQVLKNIRSGIFIEMPKISAEICSTIF